MYSCFRIDYSKLPPIPPVEKVFILDPLIATGNTACAALTMITEWGVPGNGLCYKSAS
jgi:uracil phosphoribosyltransferase